MTTKYIENVDEIESSLDPASILKTLGILHTNIQISGGEIRCACPVHKGKDPNLAINVSTHEWYCHSNGCNGTGLINLHSQATKIDFRNSAEQLANKFGISIKFKEGNSQKKKYTSEDVLKAWNEAKTNGKDVYFESKGLTPPPGVKFGNNPSGYYSVLVPMLDIEGNLQGITAVSSYGKFNFKNGDLKGAFFHFGDYLGSEQVIIGEGIATAQTAWEAFGKKIPALSVGTWSNILPVVQALKNKRKDMHIIVLIDADEGGKGTHAASLVTNEFYETTFRKPSFEHLSKTGTDFNDVMQIAGWGEVLQQLEQPFEIDEFKIEGEFKDNASQTNLQNSSCKAPDIIKSTQSKGRCGTAGDVLKEIGLLEKIKRRIFEHRQNPNEIRLSGVPTNFKKLDEIIDGLQGGHLIIFAGRTGMGKTYATLNILKNIAIDQKIPSALYSLEMSNSQIFYRLISLLSGVPATKIKRGVINDNELIKVEEAIRKIDNSPLFLSDDPANSEIKNLQVNIKNGCNAGQKVVFIDHIGLTNCGQKYTDNRATELGTISMTFKLLAKAYDIPIICLAQLNRDADKPEAPKLSQLRESGHLEQNADIVIFIHRQDYYDPTNKPGQAEIIIEKNREGETGKIIFDYEKSSWLLSEQKPIIDLIQNRNNIEY